MGPKTQTTGDSGQTSDQILGNNNIDDGPFNCCFTRGPPQWNALLLTEVEANSYSCESCERTFVQRSIAMSNRKGGALMVGTNIYISQQINRLVLIIVGVH
jgi:hypothetical protein